MNKSEKATFNIAANHYITHHVYQHNSITEDSSDTQTSVLECLINFLECLIYPLCVHLIVQCTGNRYPGNKAKAWH